LPVAPVVTVREPDDGLLSVSVLILCSKFDSDISADVDHVINLCTSTGSKTL